MVWLPHPPASSPETVKCVSGEGGDFARPTVPPLGEGLGWGERTLWLWFGVLFVLSLFFVGKPRTHVYVFFVPWGLLAGMTVTEAWVMLRARWGSRLANGLVVRWRSC